MATDCGKCDTIFLGDCAELLLTVTDEDDNPVSLTGERVYFILKDNLNPAEPARIIKDSDAGPTEIEILTVPNDNQAIIKLIETDTLDDDLEFVEGDYCFIVKVFFSSQSSCGGKTVSLGSLTFVNGAGAAGAILP